MENLVVQKKTILRNGSNRRHPGETGLRRENSKLNQTHTRLPNKDIIPAAARKTQQKRKGHRKVRRRIEVLLALIDDLRFRIY